MDNPLNEILIDYRHTSKNQLKKDILDWIDDDIIGMKDAVHVSHMCPPDNIECAKFWAVVNYTRHQREKLKQYGWKGEF